MLEQELALVYCQDRGARLSRRQNYLPAPLPSNPYGLSNGPSSPSLSLPSVPVSRKRKLVLSSYSLDEDFEELCWPCKETPIEKINLKGHLSSSAPTSPPSPSSSASTSSVELVPSSLSSSVSSKAGSSHTTSSLGRDAHECKQRCDSGYSSSPKSRKISTTPSPPSSPLVSVSSRPPRRTVQKSKSLPRSHSIRISSRSRPLASSSLRMKGVVASTPGLPYLQSPFTGLCDCHCCLPSSSTWQTAFAGGEGTLAPAWCPSAGMVEHTVSLGGLSDARQCCGRCRVACKTHTLDLTTL